MTDEVFSFSSPQIHFPFDNSHSNTTKDLVCTWSPELTGNERFLVWNFNWDKLKEQRVKGFSGEIVLDWENRLDYNIDYNGERKKIEVDLTESKQIVKQEVDGDTFNDCRFEYKYTLIPIVSMVEVYDEMFFSVSEN